MASARTSFREIRRFLAPRWATDGEGGLLGYALDIVKDAFVERAQFGLLVRFPQQGPDGTPAPEDALAEMGRDRRVVRGINESAASYALRLLKWLDDRKTAGNPFTLIQKLAEYTGALPKFRTVDPRGNWFTREPDGTRSYLLKQGNWNWDGDPSLTRFTRFWVVIYPNGLWSAEGNWGTADASTWGDGGTWGTTATPEQVQSVRSLVADWKGTGRNVSIIIALDATSFSPTALIGDAGLPDGNWAHWAKYTAGAETSARLSTARFWRGS